MGYYQKVRGHYSPVRAQWELPGYNVGARSLWNICSLSWINWLVLYNPRYTPTAPQPTPPNMTHFLIAKCQQCLKRRRSRGERQLFLFSFWRLVWLSSACLKGRLLRLKVYGEWRGRIDRGREKRTRKDTDSGREGEAGGERERERDSANSPSKASLGTTICAWRAH